MVAQVLSATPEAGQVELIGHSEVDLDELGAHLGLDLSRCSYRLVPDRGDAALAAYSSEYDFWLTASYMSRLAPKARHSAYLCWFPTPFDHDLAPWRKHVARLAGPHLRGPSTLTYGVGWYPPEGGRRRSWVWTSGDAVLGVPPGKRRLLRMSVGRPGAPGPARLSIRDAAGRELSGHAVGTALQRVTVPLPPSERGDELRFVSEIFARGAGNRRPRARRRRQPRLAAGGRTGRAGLRERPAALDRPRPHDLGFLDAYDIDAGQCRPTRGSGSSSCGSAMPSCCTRPSRSAASALAAMRQPLIVTVGRFFSPGLGHAKRQLEMVQAGSASCTARAPAGLAVRRRRRLRAEPAAVPGRRSRRRRRGCRSRSTRTRRGRWSSSCCRRAAIFWSATGYRRARASAVGSRALRDDDGGGDGGRLRARSSSTRRASARSSPRASTAIAGRTPSQLLDETVRGRAGRGAARPPQRGRRRSARPPSRMRPSPRAGARSSPRTGCSADPARCHERLAGGARRDPAARPAHRHRALHR